MRKRCILVPVIIGLMALGITAGAVLAQGGGDDEGSTSKSFAGRVADILGLDETTVQEAIQQAATEARQDRLKARLDRLVEEGVITQEQADEHQQWLDSKPEGFPHRHGFLGHGAFSRHEGFGDSSYGSDWGLHRFGQQDGDGVGLFGQRSGSTAGVEFGYRTY